MYVFEGNRVEWRHSKTQRSIELFVFKIVFIIYCRVQTHTSNARLLSYVFLYFKRVVFFFFSVIRTRVNNVYATAPYITYAAATTTAWARECAVENATGTHTELAAHRWRGRINVRRRERRRPTTCCVCLRRRFATVRPISSIPPAAVKAIPENARSFVYNYLFFFLL